VKRNVPNSKGETRRLFRSMSKRLGEEEREEKVSKEESQKAQPATGGCGELSSPWVRGKRGRQRRGGARVGRRSAEDAKTEGTKGTCQGLPF